MTPEKHPAIQSHRHQYPQRQGNLQGGRRLHRHSSFFKSLPPGRRPKSANSLRPKRPVRIKRFLFCAFSRSSCMLRNRNKNLGTWHRCANHNFTPCPLCQYQSSITGNGLPTCTQFWLNHWEFLSSSTFALIFNYITRGGRNGFYIGNVGWRIFDTLYDELQLVSQIWGS